MSNPVKALEVRDIGTIRELTCYAYDIEEATIMGEKLAEKLGINLSGVHSE